MISSFVVSDLFAFGIKTVFHVALQLVSPAAHAKVTVTGSQLRTLSG
jgi:hypothetical protein